MIQVEIEAGLQQCLLQVLMTWTLYNVRKIFRVTASTSAITYSMRLRHGRGRLSIFTLIEVELRQITITI